MSKDVQINERCLNCGTALKGPYCFQCGQKDQSLRLTLRTLFHDVLHDIWHFDHKVLNSLKLLVFRPGFLSREYSEGKRSRYVQPFRLYIFVSFVVFATFVLIPTTTKRDNAPINESIQKLQIQKEERDRLSDSSWKRDLDARAALVKNDREGFKHAFQAGFSKAVFLLMPFFAAILYLAYRKSSAYYMNHLVLSLHHHSFLFIILLIVVALTDGPFAGVGMYLALPLVIVPPLHLGIALHRIHQQSWLASMTKALAISVVYGIFVLAALFFILLITLPKIPHAG